VSIGTDDLFNPEPIGNAHDGTHVSRVLHAIEGQANTIFKVKLFSVMIWLVEEGDHRGRGFHERGPVQFGFCGHDDLFS